MNDEHRESVNSDEHPSKRLAQGAFTAVDVCECGSMQVHVGALTLRMTPRALAELADTLNHAILAHVAQTEATAPLGALGFAARRAGDA
jgi:hypothetical protein